MREVPKFVQYLMKGEKILKWKSGKRNDDHQGSVSAFHFSSFPHVAKKTFPRGGGELFVKYTPLFFMQYFRKCSFAIGKYFYWKKILVRVFFPILIYFLLDFSTGFCRFLRQFSIFHETGFSAEIPIKRNRILCI